MKESEAKTKWCPFARHVIDEGRAYPTGNRFGESESYNAQCRCIASDCMAWQWCGGAGVVMLSLDIDKEHGYCGLVK